MSTFARVPALAVIGSPASATLDLHDAPARRRCPTPIPEPPMQPGLTPGERFSLGHLRANADLLVTNPRTSEWRSPADP